MNSAVIESKNKNEKNEKKRKKSQTSVTRHRCCCSSKNNLRHVRGYSGCLLSACGALSALMSDVGYGHALWVDSLSRLRCTLAYHSWRRGFYLLNLMQNRRIRKGLKLLGNEFTCSRLRTSTFASCANCFIKQSPDVNRHRLRADSLNVSDAYVLYLQNAGIG